MGLDQTLYGSSRIGQEQIGEIIASSDLNLVNINTATQNIIGDKYFEMSNHLGNVLQVVSDRKLPVNDGNENIDCSLVDVVSYSDYYPFGVQLDGRTMENPIEVEPADTTISTDTLHVINSDFENAQIVDNGVSIYIDGWKDFSQSTISIDNNGGNERLKVISTNGAHGVQQTFSTEPGKTYTFEVDLEMESVPANEVNVLIFENDYAGSFELEVLTIDGTHTFSYTANTPAIYVQIRQAGTYYLDNITMYRTYEDTVITGGYVAGDYRYGFQGQEMDNEVKGKGNSVNYKFRMHDPRVGRFFAVDPLAPKYPFYSPYSFSGNQVVHTVELEGLEEAVLNDGSSVHTGPLDDDATIDKLEESGAWDDDKYVTEWPGREKGLEPVTIKAQKK
ncbi:hypothetical protein CW751_15055, partial [Brumimicrobium salinarum]